MALETLETVYSQKHRIRELHHGNAQLLSGVRIHMKRYQKVKGALTGRGFILESFVHFYRWIAIALSMQNIEFIRRMDGIRAGTLGDQ